ncbi:MAG: hypothetical protein ACYC6L_00400, partial [Anaerolineae bacterium]
MAIRFTTRHLIYQVNTDASNAAFIDRSTGQEHCLKNAANPCALVVANGTSYPADAAVLEAGVLRLTFGASGVSARIKVEEHDTYLLFRVLGVEGSA